MRNHNLNIMANIYKYLTENNLDEIIGSFIQKELTKIVKKPVNKSTLLNCYC